MKNALSSEELNIYLDSLNIALMMDIDDISKFSQGDIVRLERLMLINLRNLKKYDTKTLKISKKLDSMYEYRDILDKLSSVTKEEIITDMVPLVKLRVLSDAIIVLAVSHDVYDFFRKFSIVLALEYLAFRFNLLYVTSDKRKKIAQDKLTKLKSQITNEEFNYILYQKIGNCFAKKLDVQYDKLLELYPEINESDVKIKRRK